MFIVLEGGEGAGKSTQARILCEHLRRENLKVELLREPGDTALGEKIRKLVTAPRKNVLSMGTTYSCSEIASGSDQTSPSITPEAELLLFAAARAQMVTEQLRPFLDKGYIVVCDRYIYSTVAYQGYGAGVKLKYIRYINEMVTGGLKPDLVILLDIDPKTGLDRKTKIKEINEFETHDIGFHLKVRRGYLAQMKKDPQRWVKIDAGLPESTVSWKVWQAVQSCLTKERAAP